jgi:predicted DsbA family dithiol-disulfide isomerase
LKKNFSIEDDWIPFEIHPETPRHGVLLADTFPDLDPCEFFGDLDAKGRDMNIRFAPQTLLSNSRAALEAGEFAKARGHHHEFHAEIFRAYFTDGRDIGDQAVILEAAGKAQLDTSELHRALTQGRYTNAVIQATANARQQGIRVAPTFFIPGHGNIVGAQPLSTFVQALQAVEQGRPSVQPLFPG